MRNLDVVRAWSRNERARSSNGNLSTDGRFLRSYDLIIGVRGNAGARCVLDFTATGGDFRSQTTSCHVNMAKQYAHEVLTTSCWGAIRQAFGLGGP